ncbi:unnamed protein product [Onchocerca flexuosa]|uniref:RING-type domain-containing protein n=1 Tax=Onchocerca flexuosa TaxID=387005 RepID=A0A183GZA2_9BILA|nr:unnamed protein product [Onchocerca flexuosa]
MEFWFHCNNCTRRPENWIHIPSYRLTSCGHILCCECFGDTDTVKICKICHRTGIKTHAIDGTLPPYIQKFFLPLKVLIEHAEKRIKHTITFQHSQKILMERCLIVQLWYQLRKAKQDLEEKNQLEIEIVCLKKALECLKGELQRTFSNHREFEKHARQWGFRMLSIEGNGENFSRDQRAVQAVETRILTGNIDMFTNNESILANDSSSFSEISGESVDLSLKGKIDSMNKKLILSRSSSNSCLAKGATPSFNSSISITSKKDYRIGVQGSGAQRDIVSLNKLRTIRNEFNRRKSYRLQNSDGIMVPGSVYRKCAANVMYPIILLRRVRADTMTATRTANSESIRTIYKSMLY